MNVSEITKPKNRTTGIEKRQMEALVITAPREMTTGQLPLPEPKEDEVRVRLEGCGICASNLPVWQGREWFRYPTEAGAPGHEGWGIVDAVGENVSDIRKGDRVCCLSYKAYANYDLAKQDHVLKLPPFLNGLPFPGEPLGCAMNIFSRSNITEGQTVAIIGIGFLGTLLVQLAKTEGARVIAISSRKYSLEVAAACGADHLIELNDHYKIIEEVKEITGGQLCDCVIEATGKEWPLNLSIELTATRGRLVVAGYHQDGMRKVNVQMLNWKGIDMISAHERDPAEYIKGMKKAIKAIKTQRIDPFPLFTHVYPISEIATAFRDLEERPDGFIKGLIHYS